MTFAVIQAGNSGRNGRRLIIAIVLIVLWSLLSSAYADFHATLILATCSVFAAVLLYLSLRWQGHGQQILKFLPVLAALPLIVFIRCLYIHHVSGDYGPWLKPEYDYIQQYGLAGYGKKFTDYTPFYTYLMAIPALCLRFIDPVVSIKLLSFLGEGVAAYFIYRLVALKYGPASQAPLFAALIFFLLPSVMLNSAWLSQCDAWYTAFDLACVYYAIREKPFACLAWFSLALSFKLQAVFLGPFLLILLLNGRLPWYGFALMPAVYALLCLPSWLAGRSWADLATVYLFQFGEDEKLSAHGPTLYVLFSKQGHHQEIVKWCGIVLAGILMAVFSWRNRRILRGRLPAELFVFLALVSVGVTPFLLPKMHERYFFPADVFSLVLAFMVPSCWFLPVCYQLVSSFAIFRTPVWSGERLSHHSYMLFIATAINVAVAVPLYWRSLFPGRHALPRPDDVREIL